MADRFNISLPEGESKLSKWIRNQMNNNEISPSLIFRDAMVQKKAEWDATSLENPLELKKNIERLQNTISKNNQCFENFLKQKNIPEKSWIEYWENWTGPNQKQFLKVIEEKDTEQPGLEATQ